MNKLEYTYFELPTTFYSKVWPMEVKSASTFLFNETLANKLQISEDFIPSLLNPNATTFNETISPFAQAYAGHQFGHFTMLGDGRAVVLGEVVTKQQRFDLQLKGSGPTPYSRRGDGRATLKAMTREYIMSEAMQALHIPTSRSLAVIKTNESVFRTIPEPGAMLARVMKSHLRVGTFEYARYFLDTEALQSLLNYSIHRLYPSCKDAQNPALAFIQAVAKTQFDLVANWMRVGFIHGVMNTDNTAISGESFDYGPCAFINQYHPNSVFSSIDTQGRYAFGNQGAIIQWNLVRFTEALLPLIDTSEEQALVIATSFIQGFERQWNQVYQDMMAQKLGFSKADEETERLGNELLRLMEQYAADYTNTFASLCYSIPTNLSPWEQQSFKAWKEQWDAYAIIQGYPLVNRLALMRTVNPVVIPRNHQVESILADSEQHTAESTLFKEAMDAWTNPYTFHEALISWMTPPSAEENKEHQTFCGT
ncbi:MAG: protein adenylyltransferase SelO [Flavobacteriales bacterium]